MGENAKVEIFSRRRSVTAQTLRPRRGLAQGLPQDALVWRRFNGLQKRTPPPEKKSPAGRGGRQMENERPAFRLGDGGAT